MEWIAFARHSRLAQGDCRNVATRVKAHCDAHPNDPLFVFDARSSRPVKLDLRGIAAAVLRRLTGKLSDPVRDSNVVRYSNVSSGRFSAFVAATLLTA